ncbi:hypothetical protein SAMN04488012_101328 [Palleronia salina]|uniref:Trypsin-co-occurring domain-containing protein n=1 Tax=Palleronia salina TaxID=313368 RepID=A0A1M6B1R9_9RHOB|nr:trypco2 family protein [Palleronia salina]SHI42682.1 hypothetical protein SAMN04488012_101328 [Palleronia salina]
MDLKDFVKETISSIVEATNELQDEWGDQGVIVNPPVSTLAPGTYKQNSSTHTFRAIQTIKFDVAVTASSQTGGGGKVGVKVWVFEAGTEGEHARHHEEVSRVQFEVPLTLRPSETETTNRDHQQAEKGKAKLGVRGG